MENPNWRQVLASLLGISVLGIIGYFGGARTKAPSRPETPKKIQPLVESITKPTQGAPEDEKEPKKLVLDIGGAVAHPGVYWLIEGSRLDDLVQLAGGLLPSADRDRINMALVLRDGAKVSIPYKQDPTQPTAPTQPILSEPEAGNGSPPDPPVTAEPKILSINSATVEELQALPAIGQELAGRIVKYREGIGGFKSVEEIKQVRGIGDKLYEKIRAYLTL